MPKNGYELSRIENVLSRILVSDNNPSASMLRELKKELNNFFTESECMDVIFTKNTDKLFFGACVMPVISNEDTLGIVLGNKDFQVKKYYLEIDSKLLMMGLDCREFTAIILHEVGHMVIDAIPAKLVRDNIDKYFQDKDDIINIKASSQYTQLLSFAIKDTMKKVTSFRYKPNEEILADSFVTMCGYGPHLQTALGKILSNAWGSTSGVKEPKLVILDWIFRVYKDLKFARIPAIKTLTKSKSYTGSVLTKKEVDKVIDAIQKIDTDIVQEASYLMESFKKKNSLFGRLKINGLRSIEDDLYEFKIRIKNAETEDEIMYTLHQMNARMAILDDYLNSADISEDEYNKYRDVLMQYRKIRADISTKRVYNRKNYGLWYSYNQLDSDEKMY